MEILNYINGEWVKPNGDDYLDVINPATGIMIAKTPLGSKADVEAAAQAARWRALSPASASRALHRRLPLRQATADHRSRWRTACRRERRSHAHRLARRRRLSDIAILEQRRAADSRWCDRGYSSRAAERSITPTPSRPHRKVEGAGE